MIAHNIAGETEIGYFANPFVVNQHVAGGQISMDNLKEHLIN